jgi:hypothetical protein
LDRRRHHERRGKSLRPDRSDDEQWHARPEHERVFRGAESLAIAAAAQQPDRKLTIIKR